jgi:hypothetical protein
MRCAVAGGAGAGRGKRGREGGRRLISSDECQCGIRIIFHFPFLIFHFLNPQAVAPPLELRSGT